MEEAVALLCLYKSWITSDALMPAGEAGKRSLNLSSVVPNAVLAVLGYSDLI